MVAGAVKPWFAFDLRGQQPFGGIRQRVEPRCLIPRVNVQLWGDPPAWKIRVPDVTVEDGPPVCILQMYSHPINRVNLWVPSVTPDGAALPAVEIELRTGAAVGGAENVELTLAKGLGTFAVDPFFVQVSGVSAEEWSLWAHTIGGGARPIRVGFALHGGRAKCCERVVVA